MGMIAPQPQSAKSIFFALLFCTIFLPIALVYIFFYLIWGFVLCMAIWLTWNRKPVLFVYSNSPIWKDYIETEIIPELRQRAIILNWSDRKTWRTSLPVLAFKYFGKDKDFNPLAVVFRPFRIPKTYRFFKAFKKFKRGNTKPVELLKDDLFKAIGI